MSKWLNDYSHSELQEMAVDLLEQRDHIISAAEAYIDAVDNYPEHVSKRAKIRAKKALQTEINEIKDN